jgi:hypothetical protein
MLELERPLLEKISVGIPFAEKISVRMPLLLQKISVEMPFAGENISREDVTGTFNVYYGNYFLHCLLRQLLALYYIS